MPEPEVVQQDNWADLQPLLDEELSRLPDNYRLPLLLCDLEGKSIKEATQQLDWPQGTLAGRLVRARKMLAKRLTQRGVVLSGGALAVVLSEKAASACVPLSLAVFTTKAAVAIAAGQAAAPSLVSAKVAALMEGVMKGMMLTKLKTVTMVLLVLGLVAFGGSMLARHTAEAQQVNAQESRKAAISKAKQPPKVHDDTQLHGEWIHSDDENGIIILIFGSDKTVRRLKEGGHDHTGTYSVDWSKNPHHLDLKWIPTLPAGQTILEFVEPGKLRIEIGGGAEARPKAFTDEAMVFARKEKHQAGSKQTNKAAARDIEIAEFYRRTAKFGSAHFYFQLVQYRYPGTNFAEKAKQGLEDLKKHCIRLPDGSEAWEAPEQAVQPQPPPMIQEAPKASQDVLKLRQQVKALESRLAAFEYKGKLKPPAKTGLDAPASGPEIHELRQQVNNLAGRLATLEAKEKKKANTEKELPKVAKIIVVGNTTLDSAIRNAMKLVPGQLLNGTTLRTAEKNLAAFDATIEVIDTNDPAFKDILVRVKKK